MSKMPPTTPLERYLDGLLSEPDRLRVERALQTNPSAQEHVRLQRQIDEGLTRLFAGGPAMPIPIPTRRRIPTWSWAAAAAVLIVGAGAWAVFFRGPGAGGSGPSPLAGLYHAQVDGGFVPKEVCTTADEFAKWTHTYFGQSLYPPASHDGIEFVGWAYGQAVSSHSGVLLARVRGKEVIVVVDRSVRDKQPFSSAGDPKLHSFRKQLGMIVLYEVSPLDQPAILPILSTSPGG